MPDGAGGNQPDPEAINRNSRQANQGIGASSTNGLTALERMLAAREAEKRSQGRRDSRALALLALAAVVVIGGGAFAWVRFAPPSKHNRASAQAAPTVLATLHSSPTARVRPVTPGGPASSPFSGSPAYTWADGAAGIRIPRARAHGPYTATEVRSAYKKTRQLLIAGNLNWPTLRGGRPTAFADLLTKQQRQEFLAGLRATSLDKYGTETNTRTWVSSFAPGTTHFITTVVKVHGRMRASLATDSGTEVLRITVSYDFVYAVAQPGNPSNWLRIVQRQSGAVDFAQWDDPGGPLEPWYSVGSGAAGGLCGVRDGYIHPDYPHGPAPSVQPSGAPINPYVLATPAANAYGCRASTGT
jgi:hypothetical protein